MNIFRSDVYTKLFLSDDCSHRFCELNEYIRIMEQTYSDIVKLGPDKAQKTTDLIIAHQGIDEIIEDTISIPLIIEYLKIENRRMMQKFILGLEANENEH